MSDRKTYAVWFKDRTGKWVYLPFGYRKQHVAFVECRKLRESGYEAKVELWKWPSDLEEGYT